MLDTVFLYCALGGGVILVLQLGMLLLGMDDGFGDMADGADLGGDAALDGDGGTTDGAAFWFLEMISLRTLSAAATFFGLTGKACLASGLEPAVTIGVATAAGYAALYSVYWAFKQIFRLETSGNTDIRNALGLPAQVYVPIGPDGAAGKVHLELQGRTVEYQAVAETADRVPTGAPVVVTDIVSSDTVRVEAAG